MARTREDYFWSHVDKNGPIPEHRPDLGPCWLWTGTTVRNGYGLFWDGQRLTVAHRWYYQQRHGEIAKSVLLDHLCRVRPCVNDGHVEPVTPSINIRRGISPAAENAAKLICLRGHELSGANLYLGGNRRHCRTCRAERDRAVKQARKTMPAPSERTHCPKGHPYDEQNTKVERGRRLCRACRKAKDDRRNAARSKGLGLPATRTRCPRGHFYDEANTYRGNKGDRQCRTCRVERQREARAAKRRTA